ncbi:MAG TPA: DUF3857 domain-containing protein [Blastocatellia bacterium]|nr:DUF3857 domain-containing protein [Blastocatellia bacterium]
MNPHRLVRLLLFTPMCIAALCAAALADDWKPIEPEQLSSKTPAVEKDADAEALFWEVRVMDEYTGNEPRTVLSHYIRIKIFTDRGRESESKIDILYRRSTRISDIAARTIKPDGTIVTVKKEDIFERTIAKAGGLKFQAKSFAMPAVEPGAIIEYRWKETRGDALANYIRLELQREIPIRFVKYYIKPLSLPDFPYGMRAQMFHGQNTPFVKEKDGYYSTSMSNLPAYREEPRMPPEYETRAWMLVYYSEDKKLTPEKFWPNYAKETYERHKSSMKVNDDVRRVATTVIGNASSPEEKLQRLYEFCRSRIKNAGNAASGLTPDEKAKLKENKTPSDTLKHEIGNGLDIDLLFAAMATAAGFDARYARIADRGDTFFNPGFTDDYFLRSFDIAVRVGSEWRFFDPGSTYVPYGMLRWEEEGQQALICDPKESTWVSTPVSGPDKSVEKRTAKLRLSEDGTIEGDVRIEYTGHLSAVRKILNEDDSPTEREKTLTDSVKRQMSTAEITEVRVENATDPVKPFAYSYHVKVPGYGQRTGKRLFLQPGFFNHGLSAVFPTSERKYPVYFHYPWSEQDVVTIDLPAGFSLDNADAPAGLGAGKASQLDIHIGVTKDGRTLEYKRDFFFGHKDGLLIYDAKIYPQLKTLFDEIHKRDEHTITLKQTTLASNER